MNIINDKVCPGYMVTKLIALTSMEFASFPASWALHTAELGKPGAIALPTL